jgi:hypothetical protein
MLGWHEKPKMREVLVNARRLFQMFTSSRTPIGQSQDLLIPLLSLLGILALVIMACGGSVNPDTSVGTTNVGATPTNGSSSADQVYTIGDQVNIEEVIIVTVHSLSKSDVATGDGGYMYVIVDVTINNIYQGSMFDLPTQDPFGYFAPGFSLQNAAGDKYGQPLFWSDITGAYQGDGTPYTDDERNTTNKNIVRAPIPFEVPTDQHDFVLAYGAFQAGDSRVWKWDLHL